MTPLSLVSSLSDGEGEGETEPVRDGLGLEGRVPRGRGVSEPKSRDWDWGEEHGDRI